jgi:steroid 5-alpha reductase family enzyme
MIIQIALVIFCYMTIVFVVAHYLKDNSIVDVFWGGGFVVIAAFTLMQATGWDVRKLVVSFLVLIWGVRLAMHILLRNRKKGEDFRYRHWRDTWKHFVLRSFFQIFMLQGLFMLIISAPIWFINSMPNAPLTPWDNAGLLVFGIGFFFELAGDMQLTMFKKDPANRGKIITSGLWSITRHPNYFGEALVWWGISLYAISLPLGWITLISPVIITLLLRFVSGVPLLEKKFRDHPGWEDYCRKTAPYVPFLKFL